jgi:hypothetical protein
MRDGVGRSAGGNNKKILKKASMKRKFACEQGKVHLKSPTTGAMVHNFYPKDHDDYGTRRE